MSKDVNIHIKTPGADKARQDLDGVGRSAKVVGDSAHEGGRKGAAGMKQLHDDAEKTNTRFGRLKDSIMGWVGGLVSVALAIRSITSAIRIQMQAIEEHATVASSQQKKLLQLQYLGGFFKEHPNARKEVEVLSEFGRRPFEEVAGAWYNLRSKAARLSSEQRQSIMTEALELGRQFPDAPLDTLVDMFSLYAKQTGARDMNMVQNILKQTITEAGGGMADVAQYMPMFLPIGMAGGLTGPQTAGLWAYVTTQLSEPSIATTGLKATFMGLQGRGPSGKEAALMLNQLGIKPGMGFFEKISSLALAQRAGRFGLAEAEQLAGREGAAVLLAMLSDPAAMMETVSNVASVARGDVDLTQTEIHELMSSDELAQLEEHGRELDVENQNLKGGDINALRWRTFYKEYEVQMRRQGMPEWQIKSRLLMLKTLGGTGFVNPFDVESQTGSTPPIQQTHTTINNNDYSIKTYPVVGSEAERGIGPRFTQD